MLYLLILIAISAYVSWRYSKTTIDPDWSMFNLAAFTGSIYGRDFLDCKTPAIHLWYWMIAKVVGADVAKVKFTNHFLIGLVSIPVYLLTGNFWIALAFLTLINSGWLFTFHGNVGQVAVAALTVGMLSGNGWVLAVLGAIAVAFEPKLVFSLIALLIIGGYYYQLIGIAVVAVFIVATLYIYKQQWWEWLWEANIVIPKRMTQMRKMVAQNQIFFPWHEARGYLYILPWLGVAVLSKPDFLYWLPMVLFLAITHIGIVVRPNHLIPMIPWIIASGFPELTAVLVVLIIADWISSGFYWGDIWYRFYDGLRDWNILAKSIGIGIKDEPGSLWVDDLHTGIHIYSRKPVLFGMTEQIEIREVAKERRAVMVKLWKERPPDWVVTGPSPGADFNGSGYEKYKQLREYQIWRKKNE